MMMEPEFVAVAAMMYLEKDMVLIVAEHKDSDITIRYDDKNSDAIIITARQNGNKVESFYCKVSDIVGIKESYEWALQVIGAMSQK